MALSKRGSLCLILLLQVLQLNLAIVLWNTLQSSSSQSRDMECDHWSDTLRVRDQVDDDFWILILLLSSAEEHSGREFYYRARSHTWYNVWVRDMPDQHIWKCMFGMTPASAEKLCRMLAPYLTRKASNLRSPTPVDHKVMLTIHFMRTGDKMECMSQFFGLWKSTVHKYVHDVCKAIVKVMLRKYVRLPSSRGECRKLMAGFYKFSRFPNVIGCVDGVHFLVQKPNGIRGHEYTDRKRHTSVMCQAMCDHNCRFMDIISCWAGSVNDSRVMSLCSLRRKGMAGNLGHGLQCIVLGDAGYSIMPWLITPFTQRGRTGIELPRRERQFNKRLSSTRVKIEHAFGQLKGRFLSLRNKIRMGIKYLPEFLSATMILHNFCIEEKDTFLESWRNDPDSDRSDWDDARPAYSSDGDDPYDGEGYADINALALAARAVDQAGRERRRAPDYYASYRAGLVGLFQGE